MATNGVPVSPPVTRVEHAVSAPQTVTVHKATGKSLPSGGQVLPAKAAAQPQEHAASKPAEPAPPAANSADFRALLARINKHLNDSGQPYQFRVDPSGAGSKVIQEVNPASGEVIAEYSAAEFPALARGLGISGLVIDSHA
jgi:hypothetical protein